MSHRQKESGEHSTEMEKNPNHSSVQEQERKFHQRGFGDQDNDIEPRVGYKLILTVLAVSGWSVSVGGTASWLGLEVASR